MFKKTLRVLANIILVLVPFFPILENFFTVVDHNNLPQYLLACALMAVIMLALAFYINNDNPQYASNANLLLGAWLIFVLGIMVMVPLHMGPPKEDAQLLESANVEHWRYALLLVAIVIFVVGLFFLLKPLWTKLKGIEKAVIVPIIIFVPIWLWEYYDSYTHSFQLTDWINSGKKMEEFFPQYNFHQTWRAAGKVLLYIATIWLGSILYHLSIIKIWVMVSVGLFCTAGIVFCILFLREGYAYYFPFMVPAIAMAPVYWIGVALLNKTSFKSTEKTYEQ